MPIQDMVVEKNFFSDFSILKDFNDEPIFGLVNILKQERQEKQERTDK